MNKQTKRVRLYDKTLKKLVNRYEFGTYGRYLEETRGYAIEILSRAIMSGYDMNNLGRDDLEKIITCGEFGNSESARLKEAMQTRYCIVCCCYKNTSRAYLQSFRAFANDLIEINEEILDIIGYEGCDVLDGDMDDYDSRSLQNDDFELNLFDYDDLDADWSIEDEDNYNDCYGDEQETYYDGLDVDNGYYQGMYIIE